MFEGNIMLEQLSILLTGNQLKLHKRATCPLNGNS